MYWSAGPHLTRPLRLRCICPNAGGFRCLASLGAKSSPISGRQPVRSTRSGWLRCAKPWQPLQAQQAQQAQQRRRRRRARRLPPRQRVQQISSSRRAAQGAQGLAQLLQQRRPGKAGRQQQRARAAEGRLRTSSHRRRSSRSSSRSSSSRRRSRHSRRSSRRQGSRQRPRQGMRMLTCRTWMQQMAPPEFGCHRRLRQEPERPCSGWPLLCPRLSCPCTCKGHAAGRGAGFTALWQRGEAATDHPMHGHCPRWQRVCTCCSEQKARLLSYAAGAAAARVLSAHALFC